MIDGSLDVRRRARRSFAIVDACDGGRIRSALKLALPQGPLDRVGRKTRRADEYRQCRASNHQRIAPPVLPKLLEESRSCHASRTLVLWLRLSPVKVSNSFSSMVNVGEPYRPPHPCARHRPIPIIQLKPLAWPARRVECQGRACEH